MYAKKQVITLQMNACRKYIKMQFDYSLSFFCVTKVDLKPKQRETLTMLQGHKIPNETRNKTDLEQWLETQIKYKSYRKTYNAETRNICTIHPLN